MCYYDDDGKKVTMIYKKDSHQLFVVDLDIFQVGLPSKFVDANHYKIDGVRNAKGGLIENQVLVINNVFSGAEINTKGEIVRDSSNPFEKAIPNAKYDIVDNHGDDRHDGWFRLDRQDSQRFNDQDDVENRNGYRLHLGTMSFGCVTVDRTKAESKKSWQVLSQILNSTSRTTTKEKRGKWQKYLPWSKLQVYGTLVVKGKDNVKIQKNDN